jgi:hypothetical protein
MFIFMFYLQNTEQIATDNFYLNIPENDKLSEEFLPRMVIPKLSRQPPNHPVYELVSSKAQN